jgi:multiple sugar transport system substrate-binding protein
LLPDYLDFLEWMQSISDKIPTRSIEVSLEQEFAPYAISAYNPSFLQYSKVSAGYSELPYLTQLATMQLAVSTKSPSYDIFSIDNQNIASFSGSGIIPYSTLAQTYPELTYPQYDIQDFMTTVWDYVATYPPAFATQTTTSGNSGSMTLCPFDAPVILFFYRKDIYDKLGFSPPTTWDEYFEQVQKLPGNGTPYASVSEANADVSIMYEYLNHLASFGGSLWNVDGNSITPNLESDECLAALENFIRFKQYADPGSENFTWTDQFDSLSQGHSATALLWNDYYGWLNTPSRSPIAAGYFTPALNPAGPQGAFSVYGGSGMAVSQYSAHPEAAYVWMQWATCKGLQEQVLLDSYHIFPTRSSVPSVPDVESETSANPGAFAAFSVAKQAWATGTTALTPFPEWLSVLVNLSLHLNNAWKGTESPGEALTNAQTYIEQNFPDLSLT